MSVTFSVVTPTYNSELYLEEAIESVIAQRGDFYIDYVVIDNCSTDNTLSILQRYKEDIDAGRIKCNCLGVAFRFFSGKDAGMYDALSKGLSMCSGDYFSYINSDDFYLPNAFSTVEKIFEDRKKSWITGVPTLYNEYGAIITSGTPCIFKSSYIRCGVYGKYMPHIQQENTFWRRELCDELNYEELAKLKYAGDFYLWCNFAENYELCTINSQLSGFRSHSRNMSSDMSAYNEEFMSLIVNRLSVLDYPKIYFYKVLFKIFGNSLLKYLPGVINVH